MGQKRSLTDLIPAAAQGPAPALTPPLAQAPALAVAQPATSQATSALPQAGYAALERKETRLRSDQFAQLTQIRRHLNLTRGKQGERITENTLIRVAIDMLLADPNRIAGTTEAEIRKSVGL